MFMKKCKPQLRALTFAALIHGIQRPIILVKVEGVWIWSADSKVQTHFDIQSQIQQLQPSKNKKLQVGFLTHCVVVYADVGDGRLMVVLKLAYKNQVVEVP